MKFKFPRLFVSTKVNENQQTIIEIGQGIEMFLNIFINIDIKCLCIKINIIVTLLSRKLWKGRSVTNFH